MTVKKETRSESRSDWRCTLVLHTVPGISLEKANSLVVCEKGFFEMRTVTRA